MENKIQYKNFTIKEPKVENREFTAIISTSDMDLENEVLLPEGVNLKEFKNNSIILFNHNRDMPIGKALSIRKSGNGLIARAKLAEGIDKIDDIFKLIQQGILKGISVGFISLEERMPTPEDIKLFGKKVRSVISKWKLLEFSVVSIGCNQAALITSCKALNLDPKVILGEEYKEEITIEEEVEKQIKDLDIDINKEQKEQLIEVVKEKKIDMKEVMKYFAIELKKQIEKSHGQLFTD